MAVTYTIIKPKYQLERPNFEIQMKTPIPTIDNRSFTFGQIQGTHNLYDDLLNDLSDNTQIKPQPQIKSQPEIQFDNSNLLSAIKNHLGESYSQARRGQSGFSDCSSFVGKVLKDAGINVFNGLPTAKSMYESDKLESVTKARPGDLIFFRGTDKRGPNYISHIGIVSEVDANGNPTKMAHASARQYKKTVEVNYNPNYWNKFRPEIKRLKN